MATNDLSGYISFDTASTPSSASASSASSWSIFAKKLAGQSKNITDIFSGLAGSFIDASTLEALASSLGIQAGQFRQQEDWTLGSLSSVTLQEQALGIEYARKETDIYEKWNYRYGAVKTRYAARGISVESGTPLAVAGEILSSQNLEISRLKTDRMIDEWNKISVPIYNTKAKAIQEGLSADMAEIERQSKVEAANIAKTAAYISSAGKVVGAFASAYGGSK